MSKSPENNVIVATRFSRLKDGRVDGEPAAGRDVGYEALAALSEAMELLGDALEACSGGGSPDFERHERLEQRLTELQRCLGADQEDARSLDGTAEDYAGTGTDGSGAGA